MKNNTVNIGTERIETNAELRKLPRILTPAGICAHLNLALAEPEEEDEERIVDDQDDVDEPDDDTDDESDTYHAERCYEASRLRDPRE